MYHITLAKDLPSIHEKGIDPSYSRMKLRACYYVEKEKLGSEVKMRSIMRKCDESALVVLEVHMDGMVVFGGREPGIWYTKEVLPPNQILSICESDGTRIF